MHQINIWLLQKLPIIQRQTHVLIALLNVLVAAPLLIAPNVAQGTILMIQPGYVRMIVVSITLQILVQVFANHVLIKTAKTALISAANSVKILTIFTDKFHLHSLMAVAFKNAPQITMLIIQLLFPPVSNALLIVVFNAVLKQTVFYAKQTTVFSTSTTLMNV